MLDNINFNQEYEIILLKYNKYISIAFFGKVKKTVLAVMNNFGVFGEKGSNTLLAANTVCFSLFTFLQVIATTTKIYTIGRNPRLPSDIKTL